MTAVISVVAVAALIAAVAYVSWRVGRLDRLNARLEAARACLDAALVRRSSVALELAWSGLLDPAVGVQLAGLAHQARSARTGREPAESDLTRGLRTVFSEPGFRTQIAGRAGSDELVAELEATAHQVFVARTFYNDAVAGVIAARGRWLARALRMARRAPTPQFFEIDDSLAPGRAAAGSDMPRLAT